MLQSFYDRSMLQTAFKEQKLRKFEESIATLHYISLEQSSLNHPNWLKELIIKTRNVDTDFPKFKQ